jgi:hypothetical protein
MIMSEAENQVHRRQRYRDIAGNKDFSQLRELITNSHDAQEIFLITATELVKDVGDGQAFFKELIEVHGANSEVRPMYFRLNVLI